jgi:hypothetical protein
MSLHFNVDIMLGNFINRRTGKMNTKSIHLSNDMD